MLKLLWKLFNDEIGATLNVTYAFSPNTLITSTEMNTNFSDVETAVNSIDNNNVSAAAAIVESKILFSATGHGHAGGTDGKEITAGFVTGDWIISSVATARTGWTNVSATYADKFMRISATPLSTGGAATVTLSEANLAAHTHTVSITSGAGSAHRHGVTQGGNQLYSGAALTTLLRIDPYSGQASGGSEAIIRTDDENGHSHSVSGTSASAGSGTAISILPTYVTVCIFQKN